MVLILVGNSEIGAHLWCNIDYSICLKHLVRVRAVTYRWLSFIFPHIFLHACARFFEFSRTISTMVCLSFFLSNFFHLTLFIYFYHFVSYVKALYPFLSQPLRYSEERECYTESEKESVMESEWVREWQRGRGESERKRERERHAVQIWGNIRSTL